MSNPKKAAQKKQASAEPVTVIAGKSYVGGALAKQEPRKLTRAQQMQEASDKVLAAIEDFASLLSGEHVTLPMMQAGYYIVDKLWKKPIDDMRKLVNESLKSHMREHVVGDAPAPLSELTLDYGGETFKSVRNIQRHSFGKAPDMQDVKNLAEKLGVEWTALCNEVVSYEFSEERAVVLMLEKKVAKTSEAARKFLDENRVQKSESLTIEKV